MTIIPIPHCPLPPDLLLLEQQIMEDMIKLFSILDFLMGRRSSTAREVYLLNEEAKLKVK